MKQYKIIHTALGVVAGSCLCTLSLSAWERSALETCKKEDRKYMKWVKRKSNKLTPDECALLKAACDEQWLDCINNAAQNDENSFIIELDPIEYAKYQDFSDELKMKAMDYADEHKMSPNTAVKKVARDRSPHHHIPQ
jgi:hypothetical protein